MIIDGRVGLKDSLHVFAAFLSSSPRLAFPDASSEKVPLAYHVDVPGSAVLSDYMLRQFAPPVLQISGACW